LVISFSTFSFFLKFLNRQLLSRVTKGFDFFFIPESVSCRMYHKFKEELVRLWQTMPDRR